MSMDLLLVFVFVVVPILFCLLSSLLYPQVKIHGGIG